jgi:hypothetical protein
LLKVIVRESHLDTNATISAIRTKLSNLDACMLSISGDITKFNTCTKGLVESLNARGETTTDLLVNLFKGHLAVEDKSFNLCVLRKQEEHDEGGTQTEDSLMNLAKNKFTLLKDAGRCNMPSAEEEKILALQAELKQVSKKWNKEKKGNESEETEPKKRDWKDKKKDTKKRAEKPAWMSEKPKEENLRKSKSWNDKDWCWCSSETGGKCDGHWRVHKPSKCEGRSHKFLGAKHQSDDAAKDKTNSKKLKLAQAISAIQDDSDDEPESGGISE